MKTLIVTGYFLPGTNGGGPVNSINNIVKNVEGEFDIITKSTDVRSRIKYQDITFNSWLKKENYRIKYLDTKKFIYIYKTIKDKDYKVIYINSLFAEFSILFYIATLFSRTQIVIAPRGELNKNALNMKSIKKKIFISIFKLMNKKKKYKFHATSVKEQEDIKKILNVNSVLISNLPSKIETNVIRKEKKIGTLNIIMVARINKMKNIHFAITSLSDLNAKSVVLDIYGPLEDKEYLNYCKKLKVNKNIQINFKGSRSKEELAILYSNYDLFYLPTLGENYGHAIIEAIQNQLPVLISNNTPWVNLENKKVGFDYPLDDVGKYKETLQKLVDSGETYYNNKFTGFIEFIKNELEVDENIKKYKSLLNIKTDFESRRGL